MSELQILTEAAWVQSKGLNRRRQPNLDQEPRGALKRNDKVQVSVDVVSPAMLNQLGVDYPIDEDYEWRYVPEGNYFLAEKHKDSGEVYLANSPYQAPASESIVTETAWVQSLGLNRRRQPNLDQGSLGALKRNDEVQVSVDVVSPAMLNQLGVSYRIEEDYDWRYVPEGNYFLAEKDNRDGEVYLANSPYQTGTIASAIGWGANLRGGLWAGTNYIPTDFVNEMLSKYPARGLKTIRMYFNRANKTTQAKINQLKAGLQLAKSYGVNVVVVFDDSIGLSGYYNSLFDEYHNAGGELGHLNLSWYVDNAYKKQAYVDELIQFAEELNDWENVAVIDLMNEPANFGYTSQHFYDFRAAWKYLAGVVKEHAPDIPLTVGVINAQHFNTLGLSHDEAAYRFYAHIPEIDLISVHHYREADTWYKLNTEGIKFEIDSLADIRQARRLGRKVFVGEVGFWYRNEDRTDEFEAYIKRFLLQNTDVVVGCLNWDTISEAAGYLGKISEDYGYAHNVGGGTNELNSVLDLFANYAPQLGW